MSDDMISVLAKQSAELVKQDEVIAHLRSLNAELVEVLKMVAQHGRIDNSESRMNAVGAAITKGERTPSFGDFVEGCDYLPVPSTKGKSND